MHRQPRHFDPPAEPAENPAPMPPPETPLEPLRPEKKSKKHRGFSILRIYLMVCGIAVNAYALIWLLIQLFTKLGNVVP